MAEVFLCAMGQLDVRSKRDLRKAGIVVVEVDDPNKCQFIRSSETVNADDMLWACLDALRLDAGYGDKGGAQRERLAHNLFRVVAEDRKQRGAYVRVPVTDKPPKAAG